MKRFLQLAGAVLLAAVFSGVFRFGCHLHEASAQDSISGPPPLNDLEAHYRTSILSGWKAFQTSFAADGLACMNCHLSHQDIARWAGAYPKAQVFDGTPYRVKTLRQVVVEAFGKHSDLSPKAYDHLADDVVSYISWRGCGQTVRPGYSEDIPPAEGDLLKLKEAVGRGSSFFHKTPFSCANCHVGEERTGDSQKIPVGSAFISFPRYEKDRGKVVSLEVFLRIHLISRLKVQELNEEKRLLSDIAAYLASLSEGQVYRPGKTVERR